MTKKSKKTSARGPTAKPKAAPPQGGDMFTSAFQVGAAAGESIGNLLGDALRGGGRLSLNVGPNGMHFDYIKPPEERQVVFKVGEAVVPGAGLA